MKNVLQILNEHLHEEHDYLEREMRTCSDEWDFKGAETFLKPLMYTKEQLIILKNLQNPDYDRIEKLSQIIERHKSFMATSKDWRFVFPEQHLSALQAELEVLSIRKTSFSLDGDEIIHALGRLLNVEIKQFRLILDKDTATSVGVRLSGTTLELELITNLALKKQGKTALKQIGFKEEKTHNILKINNFNHSKILYCLEVLSRVTYDVFKLYGNRNAVIEYFSKDQL